MAEVTEVAVPDIGDFSDVPVIEVLVSEGESVEVDSPLVTLESDKATMEIPAPVAGTVDKLLVKLGDKVSEGTPIATIAASNGAPAAAPAGEEPLDAAPASTTDASAADSPAETTTDPAPAPPAPPAPALTEADEEPPYASPLARRMARELGVDLRTVRGTGRNGRIVRADIEGAASAPAAAPVAAVPGLAPWPQVDFAKYGEIERVPLSR